METKVVAKNDVRIALMNYYSNVIKILEDQDKKMSISELKKKLKNISKEIETKFSKSQKHEIVSDILSQKHKEIIDIATSLTDSKKFEVNQLLYDIFDGIPLTKKPVVNRAYDLVVKQDPSKTIAWIFSPSVNDQFDPLKAQIDAEQDYDIPCLDAEIIEKDLLKDSQEDNEKQEEQTEIKSENKKTEQKILGKVLFSKRDQLVLREEDNKDEINGFLFEEYATSVRPLDILVLESQEEPKKIYARTVKIDMNPLSGGGYVRQFSEIATHVLFRPLLEISLDYKGPVRPMNLSGFIIRKPTPTELNEVLNIPAQGLPIGKLDYDGTHEVFKYPLKPSDTIYQSFLIAGVQGKGKSNFLKLMVRSLSTNIQNDTTKRPAIIILDGEGEYVDFTKKNDMPLSAKNFLDKYGIGDVKPNVYTINDDTSKSNATLSLRGIKRQDIIYLMPELESKTENILRVLLNHVGNQLDEENGSKDIETLRNHLLTENNNSQLIHVSQRPAIARAILSRSLNLLDQREKTPLTPHLLFKPGTVSVIHYQGLDQNMKRVVALYLLQLLDEFKMNQTNSEPGVLLMIDEAEILFPENPSKGDKDYVQRIAARMEDITNRGRKRKYGVCLVTHLPSEVSKKVGDLANTKIAFGCSGAEKWIRNYYGKEYVNEINSMPTGFCRIVIKVNTDVQGPINARLKIPFVGDKSALPTKEVNTS